MKGAVHCKLLIGKVLVASGRAALTGKLQKVKALFILQDYLLKWPKTLLVVSHARDFLNTTCTDVLHLHHYKITAYRGNYDVFEKTAAERHRNAKKAAEGQERQKKHMQAS